MTAELSTMELRSSPHVRRRMAVPTIMRNVTYALVPVAGFAVYAFGLSAFCLIVVCTGACVLTEHVICRVGGRASTVGDFSAVITGVLLALTLPPGFPIWMGVLGGVIAIALGKALFGGLGYNVFNPALVARAFLQASFPAVISTWTPAFAPGRFVGFVPSSLALPFVSTPSVSEYVQRAAVDGFTGATPLALWKFQGVPTETVKLLTGMTAGSVGETSSVIILLCGAYLVARGMMNWRIPVSILLTVFVVSGGLYLLNGQRYPSPWFMLFSGGLMLGAVFMASDMVGSPVTRVGVWLYGCLIGLVTLLIRLKGGLPEGVMYAILIGNGFSSLIDNLTQSRVYGAKRTVYNR